ncbi:hypothetical protein MSP8886_01416 [Marinomonas spartinae]|uniref:Uncharacterized protein n=1 Tax=Marinomonas spartinae TaxID=1792290 RepID=A0A1A8TAF9_9GAMM|nr:hypothetical protein [Marinomonas spartinae]SBS29049.1 hypothetical protein MSP8886_01416 [Marinomonas spartinae]
MRWKDRNKMGSLGWLSWAIVNKHVDTLVSSSADAGWAGVSNTGKICDMLESGVVPEFGGGGESNAKMIRAIESLTAKSSGYGYLFESLSPMQRLCLFAAVLSDGRKDARGIAPSNRAIVGSLPLYAAELRLKAQHFKLTENRFEKHVAEGKSRFLHALAAALGAAV